MGECEEHSDFENEGIERELSMRAPGHNYRGPHFNRWPASDDNRPKKLFFRARASTLPQGSAGRALWAWVLDTIYLLASPPLVSLMPAEGRQPAF